MVFFNAMYSVLLAGENLMNQTQLLRDCTASMTSACDSLNTDSRLILALIASSDDTSESGLLLQFVVQNADNLKQQLKLIKRRLPQDASIITCGLSENLFTNLRLTTETLGKSMAAMHQTSKLVQQAIANSDDVDATIEHVKLTDILSTAFERIYEQDDRGPAQNLRAILSDTNTEMAQLAQYLLDNEYEIMSGAQTKAVRPVAPIVQRAQCVKRQLEETKTLTANLENREAEIRQLKLASKLKQSELSEMQIRKDLAEKKLSVLQNDHEVNTEKLQRKYDETCAQLRRKEKEFEETMDHLQNDIDSLESERGALREKLKGYGSKKGDLKASTAFDITAGSPYIAQELLLLKKAFNDERNERLRLQAADMKRTLGRLAAIHVPQPKDQRIVQLEQDLAKAKRVSDRADLRLCMRWFVYNSPPLQLSGTIGLHHVSGHRRRVSAGEHRPAEHDEAAARPSHPAAARAQRDQAARRAAGQHRAERVFGPEAAPIGAGRLRAVPIGGVCAHIEDGTMMI